MEFRPATTSLPRPYGNKMTISTDGLRKRRWRGLVLLGLAAALAGCATTDIEDIAPVAAPIEQPLPEQTSAIPTSSTTVAAPVSVQSPAVPEAAGGQAVASTGGVGAAGGEVQRSGNNTGQFPNLNVVPVAAAPQLTASEQRAKLAELEAARKKAVRGASGKTQANETRLKKLAKSHAEDALEEIEGQ